MDQTIDEWYKTEDRAVGMIGYFTVIACMLAIMGIFGDVYLFYSATSERNRVAPGERCQSKDVLNMLIWGFLKWGYSCLCHCRSDNLVSDQSLAGYLSLSYFTTGMGTLG